MIKKRFRRVLMILALIIILMAIYAIPAMADNGDIDVEIVLRGFNGGQTINGMEFTFFNKKKVTGINGTVKFRLRGLADNEVDLMKIFSSNLNFYSEVTTNLSLAPVNDYSFRANANMRDFDLDILYTSNTDAMIINAEISQSNSLDIISIDFEEKKGNNNPQNEPPLKEPHGDDPDVKDPDREGPLRDGFMVRADPLMIGLIAAVGILFIIVIILLVSKNRKKK